MFKCLVNKIALATLTILIITLNTFAATVSDNDGSAFITKAEFDSLKNTFQSQLDNYNNGIDNKIDTAIASYLSGISITSKTNLSSFIDADGKYGSSIKLKWSSSTTNYQINMNEWTYALTNYRFSDWELEVAPQDPAHPEIITYNSIPNGYFECKRMDGKTGKQLSEADAAKYGIWYVYKVKKVNIDGEEKKTLIYEKVQNTIAYNTWFCFTKAGINGQKPSTSMSMGNTCQQNLSILNQKTMSAGVPIDYMRIDPAPDRGTAPDHYYYSEGVSVLKTLALGITQKETTVDEHVYRPFSNYIEPTWDKDDDTTLFGLGTNDAGSNSDIRVAETPIISPIGELYFDQTLTTHQVLDTTLQLNVIKNPRFRWQRVALKDAADNDIKAKDFIINNYYSISNKNRAQKNGLVLGTTSSKNEQKLSIECVADVAGKVYFYVGNTPIDNWTSGTFSGKKFDLAAGTAKTCSYGEVTKDTTIWVLFAPTNTAAEGTLKINTMYTE